METDIEEFIDAIDKAIGKHSITKGLTISSIRVSMNKDGLTSSEIYLDHHIWNK